MKIFPKVCKGLGIMTQWVKSALGTLICPMKMPVQVLAFRLLLPVPVSASEAAEESSAIGSLATRVGRTLLLFLC